MIERLLENWLIRANERSFQIPFCQWLAYKGYTVVHLSRHCAMEMGKDVIAIAPDGVPCAYQLKGVDKSGRLSLSAWRDDLSKQLTPLALGRIVHPSIPPGVPHRSYIVVNGDLSEEVCREIDDFNRGLVDRGLSTKIEVILRGELFQAFKELQTDFWATNLVDLKTYLELYLEDGRGMLPKAKLARLMEASLSFDKEADSAKAPGSNELAKTLAGAAITCASAISAFTIAENHLAEFEAWIIYLSYSLALAERWGMPAESYRFATEVAWESSFSALARLCDELMARSDLTEGDVLSDRPMQGFRTTHLVGLMSIYGLWLSRKQEHEAEATDTAHLEFAKRFVSGNARKMALWGEYAVPQFIAAYFFHREFDPTQTSEKMLLGMIGTMIHVDRHSEYGVANPYYEPEDFAPYWMGFADKPLNDHFKGTSYCLEGLMQLAAQCNLKQSIRSVFPIISKIGFRQYVTGSSWKHYFYRDETGKNQLRFLQLPYSWGQLRELASEDSGAEIPDLLRVDPIVYLSFLSVYPHRFSSSGLRWLSKNLRR